MQVKDDKVLKALQDKEFEMLLKIKEIFQKNGIKFFLAWGTALGAVRHNDFIPWDDDIDIYVFGSDYAKIKEIFNKQDTGNLTLQDGLNTKNYPYSFPKIISNDTVLNENSSDKFGYNCGVYIDLFLLHGVPNNLFFRNINVAFRYFNYGILRAKYCKSGFVKNCSKLFPDRIANYFLYKIYAKPVSGCNYLCEPTTFDKTTFLPVAFFTDCFYAQFRGSDFPIPKEYDKYLTFIFGNYMELPPIEKRKSNHNFTKLVIDEEELI